jgi:hypothetical protein
MAKRYHTRYKPHPQPIENYSTEDQELSYTHDPLTPGTPTGNWNIGKSTSASSHDESENEEFSPAPNTWPSFATEVMRGQIGIRPFILYSTTVLAWLGANLWILIQDNSHQLLQTTDGWIMYGNKVGVASIIYLIASIILGINWWFMVVRPRNKNKSAE